MREFFFKSSRKILNIRPLRYLISDKTYLKIVYRLKFGHKLNLDNPKTFNEKLQWLKLNDRNADYTPLVDKCEVKNRVAKMVGDEYVIPTIGVYDSFDDIDFSSLPDKFVIKCTHDSGGLVVCNDKKTLNIAAAKKKINKCLKKDYYYASREWPYKNVKPRIIIEKYMEDDNSKTDGLTDYKFMCFGGRVEYIFTCTERFSGDLKVTFFDKKWNKMPFERHYHASDKIISKPRNFDEMLRLSEKLSKGIPFVRMDWYEINGKVYFGEYTFYPGAGFEEFTPESWDLKIGEKIKLGGDQ